MAITASRQAKIFRACVIACFCLLLACVIVEFFALVGIQGNIRKLNVRPSQAQEINFQLVEDVVRRVLASSSPSSAVSTNTSPSIRFVAVSDLATWESVDRRPMARLGGVDCGIGDYTEYGIILSIRPRRLICRSPDSSLVVLGASAKPASVDGLPAASGRLAEAPKPAPSW